MSFNPYQPPTSAYDSRASYGTGTGMVSDRTIAALRKTRPWVVLIAVVGLVFSAFGILGGLALLSEGAEGLVTILLMAVYLAPSIALIRFGNAINKLLHGGGVAELEESVEAQASFWQLAGIFTLIGIGLMILAFIGAIVFASKF